MMTKSSFFRKVHVFQDALAVGKIVVGRHVLLDTIGIHAPEQMHAAGTVSADCVSAMIGAAGLSDDTIRAV